MATILNIRGVTDQLHRRFAANAVARGLSQAEYLQLMITTLDHLTYCVSPCFESDDDAEVAKRVLRIVEDYSPGDQREYHGPA